jgi:hypothetical protein
MVDQSVHPESKSMLVYALLYTQEQANKQLCHFFIPTKCGHTISFLSLLGWPLKVTLLDQSGVDLKLQRNGGIQSA